MLAIEPRRQPSRAWSLLSPAIAIALTLCVGALLFGLAGRDPGYALYVLFIAPLTSTYGLTELLVKATPLILIATGLAIGFRANVWNIGAEGQYTVGALAGGGLALAFHDSTSPLLLPAMLLAGCAGGMAWGAIPALLRTRFNVNEILSSLMLTYVAILLLSWLVHGPWRDPDGYNFPESRLLSDAATLPTLVDDTRLHAGLLFALLAVAAAWVLMGRSVVGFQLRVSGQSRVAARYAGYSTTGLVWFALLVSGGLAGLAGISEVSGTINQLLPTISPGYGFTAIIVAFLGRLHPLGIIPAGLLIALSYIGGELAQIEVGVPAAVTGIFQGVLLFFLLGCDLLTGYRVRLAPVRGS